MASLDLEDGSEIVVEEEDGRTKKLDSHGFKQRGSRKKKTGKISNLVPKWKCFNIKSETDKDGNLDMEVEEDCRSKTPTHLIIMVNGLVGSAQNWKFAAKQFLKKYPNDVIVHCSKCNPAMLTFDGVDVMGERLAEEVMSVIKRHPSAQKISFIGHSLGGLVTRYAIAKLYERDINQEASHGNGVCDDGNENSCQKEKFKAKIAGLEPMNFITSATPHLGSRGHRQVPVFCGIYTLEKVACRTSWCLGRTGRHLFLTDNDNGQPPLLLRMASDSEDLKFISALQSFKRRVAYANVHFDHIVGWSTSSLRRWNELPKLKRVSRHDKYPHIVNVEAPKTASSQDVPVEGTANRSKNVEMEEKMIRGLTKLSWERVDVNFSGSRQKYLAHQTIQVKTYYINSDGADVIQHMIDNFLL